MAEEKYVEVEGIKFIDDGTGSAKLDESGQPIPFVEEKTVPYSRFKEVNDAKNKAETRLEELEKKKESGTLSVDEKKEMEAKTYLKGLYKEVLKEEKAESQEAEKREQAVFEKEVAEELELNPDIKKADFLKFMEEKADKYGVVSVKGGVELYKDLQTTAADASDRTKKDLSKKPNTPPSNEGGSHQKTYPEDKGKTLWQIAEDAKSKLK